MERILDTKPVFDLNKEVLKKEIEKKIAESKSPSSIEDGAKEEEN